LKPTSSNDAVQRRIPPLEILAFLIVGLAVDLVQGALLPGYLRAEVLLVLVVYVGWSTSPLKGAVVGTIFGILEDYLVGIPIGLNGLSMTLVGFLSGYLSRWMSTELGPFRVLLFAGLALLDRVIILGTLYVLAQNVSPVRIDGLLLSAFLTGIIGEVFFGLYDKIRFPPKDFRRLN
jgi:rod shape-determining protein MreD